MTEPGGDIVRLRSKDVSWRTVGDQVIVLDGRNWAYLSVNEAGERLWAMLDDGATRESMAAALVAEYGIGEDQARSDVDEFLAGLRRHDLIEDAAS